VGHQRQLIAAFALLMLAAVPARALEVDARVASVRPGTVYLELDRALEVRLGARVVVRPPRDGEAEVRTAVLALSSKYVVVEAPGLEGLAVGDRVRLVIDGASAPATAARAPEAGTGPPSVGLPVPTTEDYARKPAPALEPVPFRRRPASDAAPAVGARTTQTVTPRGPDDEDETGEEPGTRANEVSGEAEVGVDVAVDDASDIDRTMPFARLALDVDRLGGSDRARLRLYGSVRQSFDGEWDLTGHNEDDLIAELTALVLEVDAAPEEQVHGFLDRVELRLGRAAVPAVVEAGLIDGLQLGVRFGAITLFGYGGIAASPNPQRSDYDSVAYGGGVRFARTFAHSGALRLSLSAGQERFREEGERDFIESQLDGRYDRFSIRGALVVDFFDTLKDRRDIRLTTGVLRLGWQASTNVRVEVGYSERRPLYQAEFIRELFPVARAFLDRDERRNIDAFLSWRFGAERRWDVSARGTLYLGDGGRNATGGGLSLGKNDTFGRDRVAIDLLVHHRLKGSGHRRHSTDPYVNLSYSWFGEVVTFQAALFYRATIPEEDGDQRVGARLSADVEVASGFGIRGYSEVEFRRISGDDSGEAFLLGLAVRYSF
jgi:hypothetical protein